MGLFRAADGRFDLVLTLIPPDPLGEPHNLDQWEAAFQHASDLLFHATDGQHALGELSICPDGLGASVADFWIYNKAGNASADARIWLPGTHVIIYADEQNRPFTILHELGHFLYGLRDEFKFPGGAEGAHCLGRRGATEAETFNTGQDKVLPGACIMEAGWLDGDHFDSGSVIPGTVTDFCVECNHDRGAADPNAGGGLPAPGFDDVAHDTRQTHTYQGPGPAWWEGTSCWSVMGKFYPDLVLPSYRPDPDDSTPGPPTIGWTVLETDTRLVLAVDHSQELCAAAPWAWVPLRRALKRFVRMSPDDERFGMVSITLGLPSGGMAPLTPGIRHRAAQFIDSATPEPGVPLNRGLRKAARMIEEDGPRSCAQAILLISGSAVAPTAADRMSVATLRRAGIRVFGLAVGPEADVARLSAVCEGTGGKWYRVLGPGSPPGTLSLSAAMLALHADLHPADGLITVGATLPGDWPDDLPDLPNDFDTEFVSEVDWDCTQGEFLLLDEEGKEMDFRLIDPDGEEVSPEPVDGSRARRIANPTAGAWRVLPAHADPAAPPATRTAGVVEHIALGRSETLRFILTAPRLTFALGEEVSVVAQVTAGVPLLGYECVGVVTDPEGLARQIEFQNEPDGGLYTARFTPSREGDHRIRCDVRGLEADVHAAPGADSEAQGTGAVPAVQVPDFTRTAFLTIRVVAGMRDPEKIGAERTVLRLRAGESVETAIDLEGIPWVPGVSRLHLGPGIRVTELPERSSEDGRPVFLLEIAESAPPGRSRGVVRQGGRVYALEGLAVVEGEAPPPLIVSPEREWLPGRFLRRLLEEREDE